MPLNLGNYQKSEYEKELELCVHKNLSTISGNFVTVGSDLSNIVTYASKANAKILSGTLDEGIQSKIINVIGDSTGNGENEWVHLLTNDLVEKYPSYNVKYSLIDPNTFVYPPLTILHQAGADRCINSAAPNYARRLVSSVVPNTYTDVDFRIKVNKPNWLTGVEEVFGSQFDSVNSTPERAWRFYKAANGAFVAEITENGSTIVGFYGCTVNASQLTNNQDYYFRFVIDCDNGASEADFIVYSSVDDGATWTQLSKSTIAGAKTLYKSSTAKYYLGGYAGNGAPASMKIYKAELMDSIGGNNIFPASLDCWNSYNCTPSTAPLEGTPEIIVYNSSISGYSTTSYTTDLLKKAIVNGESNIVIVSLSHNEGKEFGEGFTQRLKTICDTIKTLTNNPIIALVTQNPEKTPAYPHQQSMRRNQIISFAHQNGYDCIDVYHEFVKQEKAGVTGLINSIDGVHPIDPNGNVLFKNVVRAHLGI